MNVIQKDTESNGARPAIMPFSGNRPPEGWIYIAPGIDTSAMQTHQGFVDLTVESGIVTAITGNDAAYQAYLDSLPKPEPPTMTTEEAVMDAIADLTYRMDLQTLGLTEVTQ